MFTVKATYRGETRKFTFNESTSFPSYDQLYRQLYRVFPISHNFFLSKLLFSPDSSKSRILIAQEVHAADDYVTCISRYSVGYWPNPLLKFTVLDETPHKLPNNPSGLGLPLSHALESSAAPQPQNPFGTPIQFGTVNSSPFPPISFSHIPPPPIIFSSAHSSPQVPTELEVTRSCKLTPPPQPQPEVSADATKRTYCCAPTQCKEEVKDLISGLRSELERIVLDLNDMSSKQAPSVQPVTSSPPTPPPKPQGLADPIFPSLCQFNFCSQCGVIKQGPWFHCGKCDNKICVNCHDASTDSNCLVATGPHLWKMMFCPSCPQAPEQPVLPGMQWNTAAEASTPIQWNAAVEASTPLRSNVEPTPLASPTLPNLPSVPTVDPWSAGPDVEPSFMDAATNSARSRGVVHNGVACDVCHSVIEGVRHKCLDCADYDLCTICITSGSAERHNPFHEFIELHEPGRVIVHTVLNGNGEREATQSTPRHSSVVEDTSVAALHSATCDLCDSRIRGDRYKCVDCPDFDTCQSCFSITHEQHPHHAFVRLTKAEDFIRRPELERPAHLATCNICTHAIFGVRYKCMHPDCPDFDLCENCEAHPIAVHPSNHPLLKMKDARTRVPGLRAQEPVPVPAPIRTPVQHDGFEFSATSVSENGQIRDTVEDLVYQPPSPFFFRTETGGSNSPVQPHEPVRAEVLTSFPSFGRERSPSPPLPIPGALPSAFNLPELTPTSPILKSPILQPFDDTQRNLPTPPSLTPLWKRMSLPSHYFPSPPPPPPRWNLEEEVRQTQAVLQRRFSELRSSMTRHSDLIQGIVHRPSVAQERTEGPEQPEVWRFSPRERPVNPEQSEVWRFLPRVPSQLDSEREGPQQLGSLSRHDDPPITLPPIRPWSTYSSGLWPETAQEMRHMMNDEESRSFFESSSPIINHTSAIDTQMPVPEESPVGGEALLNNTPPSDRVLEPEDAVRSLAAILNNPEIAETKNAFVEDRAEAEVAFPELPTISSSTAQISDKDVLSAEFVIDRSVPDGQEFPPGAEFVKSWCMANTGSKAWPRETELVFVAGEDLSLGEKNKPVKVGAVQPGETIDLWTEELKAPDVPGRYVGYYRLRDDAGNLFGHSIWLDISVSETHRRAPSSINDDGSSPEEYSSISSSSIVIMPQSAPSVPSVDLNRQTLLTARSPSIPSSPVTAAYSDTDVLENISNPDSEVSSVSMVSVPSEEEDEDEELYRDCRSSIQFEVSTSIQTLRVPSGSNPRPDQDQQIDEYVVLYDEATSSEED